MPPFKAVLRDEEWRSDCGPQEEKSAKRDREGKRGDKKKYTIEHVNGDAGRIGVAGYASVIAAVAEPGLRDQELARRPALRLLRLQGYSAPAVNAELCQM